MSLNLINAGEIAAVLVGMRRIVLACLLLCGAMQAQSLTTDPPPIVQILRKPGTANDMLRGYSQVQAAVNALGMRAVTGVPETWTVEAHYSFASVEDLDKRLAGSPPARDEAVAPTLTMVGLYRPAWSFRPAEAVRLLPRARYLNVTIFRIRPGTEAEFGELVRLRRATADAINLERPDLAFQVMSGAPSGTFIFLSPLQTLRLLDDGMNPVPVYAEGIAAARQKDGKQIASDIEVSREHFLLRIDPRLSWVENAFSALDQDFWRK